MKLLAVLVSFGVILALIAILGSILERYWRQFQSERAAARQPAKDGVEENATGGGPIGGMVAHWREQLQTLIQAEPSNAALVAPFREWIENELQTEKTLQSWLLKLPEPGFALLTDHIAAFCVEMNFNLAWLFDPQLAVVPDLKRTMRSVVIDYCQACYKSIPIQVEAQLFAKYQELLRPSKSKQVQALRRALLAELIAHDLISSSNTAELLNAPDQEQQQQIIKTIQVAAAKGWSQFAPIFHATLFPPPPAPPSDVKAKSTTETHAGQNGVAKATATTSNGSTASPLASASSSTVAEHPA